ncbi:pantetheine-phosphate adenylyltransferase [Companilactobacillus baiquanensis]|uniref:Phosphopantetheine adenylyltransferase n=1 Tax=Companilactobacillus baiquanensis TaxID=2486005 RepID=A0ABW1UXD5_9LACO|nr:pantetheine-phosphate adenylyltransferase [Companilactobacillus baiquanensis]
MPTRIGMYAGSFDPVTNGHLTIIRRASKLFDELIVATMTNNSKNYMFDYEEKKAFIEAEIADLKNVRVIDGKEQLTTKLAKEYGANTLVRSMRNSSDFNYEAGVFSMNKSLNPEIETIFLLADSKYANISSSMIKEVTKFGGDVTKFVPENVATALIKKLRKD